MMVVGHAAFVRTHLAHRRRNRGTGVMNMDIHPIRTENDYRTAMQEISAFFDHEPETDTLDGDRFEILIT